MSAAARDWAWPIKAGGPAAKAVLMALAHFANDEGLCWPSQARLAEMTELTDRSVRDQLVKLAEAGLIEVERDRRANGSYKASTVRLMMGQRKDVPVVHQRNEDPHNRKEVPVDHRNDVPNPPEPRSYPTTFEPTLEPKEVVASPKADDVKAAFDAWNEIATRLKLPVARKLADARRRAIRSRLAGEGWEAWGQALRAVAASKFCRGDSERGWRADLDFVCQPKSWRRLLEGFYGPTPPTPPAAASTLPVTPEQRAHRERHYRATGEWRDAWGARPEAEAVDPIYQHRKQAA